MTWSRKFGNGSDLLQYTLSNILILGRDKKWQNICCNLLVWSEKHVSYLEWPVWVDAWCKVSHSSLRNEQKSDSPDIPTDWRPWWLLTDHMAKIFGFSCLWCHLREITASQGYCLNPAYITCCTSLWFASAEKEADWEKEPLRVEKMRVRIVSRQGSFSQRMVCTLNGLRGKVMAVERVDKIKYEYDGTW